MKIRVDQAKENIIASKADERKAIKKIREIIDNLGEESYTGQAFKGAFEIAESNIDNDFMDSVEAKLQYREQQIENERGNADMFKQQAESLERETAQLKKDYEWLNGLYNRKTDAHIEAENKYCEEFDKRIKSEKRIETLENEVIKLKAKLYDLMTANEQ